MNTNFYIRQLLHRFGLTSNHVGFVYIVAAIRLALENGEYLHNITKLLYPDIAKAYGTNKRCVERNIRTAINLIWKFNAPLLHKIMGNYIGKKPSNGCFIAILLQYCIEHEIAATDN